MKYIVSNLKFDFSMVYGMYRSECLFIAVYRENIFVFAFYGTVFIGSSVLFLSKYKGRYKRS